MLRLLERAWALHRRAEANTPLARFELLTRTRRAPEFARGAALICRGPASRSSVSWKGKTPSPRLVLWTARRICGVERAIFPSPQNQSLWKLQCRAINSGRQPRHWVAMCGLHPTCAGDALRRRPANFTQRRRAGSWAWGAETKRKLRNTPLNITSKSRRTDQRRMTCIICNSRRDNMDIQRLRPVEIVRWAVRRIRDPIAPWHSSSSR